jgi:curved DNA-binding protein CbpA
MKVIEEQDRSAGKGRLRAGSILEVVRQLHGERATGVIQMARGEERLSLRIVNGQIVSGSSGPAGRIGEILVRCGLLGRSDLERALARAGTQGRRLGPVLCEMGLVSRERLEDALRLQVRDALLAGLFWPEGEWALESDDSPAPFPEDVTLRLSTPELLLEAVRRIDDPAIVREALGDLEAVLAPVEHPPLRLEATTLGPADGYVLSRADGSMTAREILRIAPLPADEVSRSLLALLSSGVIERRLARPKPAPGPRRATVAAPAAPAAPGEGTPVSAAAPAGRGAADVSRQIESAFLGLTTKNHFQVLGISRSSSAEEVKAAYVTLARTFHPDALGEQGGGPLEEKAQAVFMRVTEAYQTLRGVSSRARYEERLGGPRLGSSPGSNHILSPSNPDATTFASSNGPSSNASFAEPGAKTATAAAEPPPLQPVAEVLREAEEHLAAGRPWEATLNLEEVLARSRGPVRERAHLLLANALARSPSGAKRAEAELKLLLEEDPTSVEGYLALGQLYHTRGFTGRAEAMFRHALSLEPRHARAAQELASVTGVPAGSGSNSGIFGRITQRMRR